ARPELDPAARHQVEHGHPLGRAGRVVVAGGGLDDAVAEPDVLRALRAGGQEHLGGAGVRVLLEEVVLDLPHDVEAQAVGQLDLLEGVLDERQLAAVVPGAGELVLVEDAELHGAATSVVARALNSASRSAPLARVQHQCSISDMTALRVTARPAPRDWSSRASHRVPIISVPSWWRPPVPTQVRSRISVSAVARKPTGGVGACRM